MDHLDPSLNTCVACNKVFVEGDVVILFHGEQLKIGEKSGQLVYIQGNYADERVHYTYSCLEKCFSPADNPFLYDSIVDRITKEREADMRIEILDDLRSSETDDEFSLYHPYGLDEIPFCLWCKNTKTVWLQPRTNGTIFYCSSCAKWWDDEENELDGPTA